MKRTADELYPLELLSGLDDDMIAEAMLPDKITQGAPVPARRKPRPIPSLAHSSRAAAWLTVLVSVTVLLGVILAAGLAEGWRSKEEDNPFPDFAPDAGRPNEDKSDLSPGESTADTTAPDTTPSDPNGDTWPEATEDFSYFQNGYFLSAESWEMGGWLTASGVGARGQLMEILPTLTAVTRPVGTTIDFTRDRLWNQRMNIHYVWVYDAQGNALCGGYTPHVLTTLPTGTYCVVLSVYKWGDYIQEGNDREQSEYEYAFILRLAGVEEVDQPLTVRLGRRTYTLPPFLRFQTISNGMTVDYRGVDRIKFDQYHDYPVEHEGALVPRLHVTDLHDVEVVCHASGSRFVSLEVYDYSYDGDDVLLARFDDESYRTRLGELDDHAGYGIFTFEIREGEKSALVEYPFYLTTHQLNGCDPFTPNSSITVSVGGKTVVPAQYGGWGSSIVTDENGEEHMVSMHAGFGNDLFYAYLDLLPSVTASAGTPIALGGLKEDEESPLVYFVYDMSGAYVDYSLDELSSLKPGAYCVIFTVSSKGRYSEKFDAYESFGSHYGFYLVIE